MTAGGALFYIELMDFLLFFPRLAFSEVKEAGPESPALETSLSLLESLVAASPLVQLTFVILLVMSIVSWAVIFQKGLLFKTIKEQNKAFEDIFLKYHSFEDIYNLARSHENSPLANIFSTGYNELLKVLKFESSTGPLTGEDNIQRALRKESHIALSRLESGLGFLATAGSSCPFIGLFGTVFGIMDAFGKIAALGSASLAVVAPGIAEALLATGLGLFAAIPALIFYNSYMNKMRLFEMEFEHFSFDFINIAKRNFFKSKQTNTV